MSLSSGMHLGPYEIIAPIGAGGMGEVYKARDTRLNRFVAIKVLPLEWVSNVVRKQRFIQEAQAASALNHANIITIHDIAIDDGRDYLVMEYVPGKTLDRLIPRTGMPINELLKIAIQVAEGLRAAHGAGIIHRDLKPSNIIVSEMGQVKILDFGLAKLSGQGEGTEDDATLTLNTQTKPGTVMGTAAYMSPEQAEGKPLDARSDIFSFGAVLYEMATGCRAFPGKSQAATIAALLNREPRPLSEAAPDAPQELDRVIMRCLRKDRAKRQQHMTDMTVLLAELKEESDSGRLASAVTPKTPRRRWPWVVAASALIVLSAGTGWWLARGHEEQPPRVVAFTTFAGREGAASFSPDGNQVVFCWNGEKEDNVDLYVKMVDSSAAHRLTTDPALDLFPAWSPDGRQIAFFKPGQGIYLISPLGGPEHKLAEGDVQWLSWSPDGKCLVVAKYGKSAADPGGLFLVPVQSGEPRRLLADTSTQWYRYPVVAPAGRFLAFASCTDGGECDISVMGLNADFVPEGKLRQVAQAGMGLNGLAWTADGRSLIYSAGISANDTWLWRLNLAGGEKPRRLEIASRGASRPAIALKGNRLAFDSLKVDDDIFQLGVGAKPQPFLVSSMLDLQAQFSPDGRRIAFSSGRGIDRVAIWTSNVDGTGVAQLTRGSGIFEGSPQWSPDGRWIAYDSADKVGRRHIEVVASSGGPSRQLNTGPLSSKVPSWSRDGNRIYFTSERSGRFEIWRTSSQGGAAEQITRAGGYVSLESPDAKKLYYTKSGDDGPLFAQPLGGGKEVQVLERVSERGFVLFDDGIYYLTKAGDSHEIRFREFASGRSSTVSPIEGSLALGFSVSPDRKTFLYTSHITKGSDLMLIENFR